MITDNFEESHYRKATWQIILLFLVFRLAVAGLTSLGNDEVYYTLYSQFPSWSHFDHPPAVGWLIWIFTLHNFLHGAFFARLGAIFCGTCVAWFAYLTGKEIHSPRAGWISALLISSSLYFSVIAGIFILPDAPLLLGWSLALVAMVKLLKSSENNRWWWLLAIAFTWCWLSKYHAVFLVGGWFAFVIFHRRDLLRKPAFYFSLLGSVLGLVPVIWWNAHFDFISFTYHESRVGIFQQLRPDFFLQFLLGQIGYQNPLVFGICAWAIWRFRKLPVFRGEKFLLLWLSLPLIAVLTLASLEKATLPHWSGPSFLALIILAAFALSELKRSAKLARWAAGLALFAMTLGAILINTGWGIPNSNTQESTLGKGDFTLDLYNWANFGRDIETHLQKDFPNEKPVLISNEWFPAGHLDYYLAEPYGYKLLCFNDLAAIHKYAWVNEARGGLKHDQDAVFVGFSNLSFSPQEAYSRDFTSCSLIDSIPQQRGGKTCRKAYLYLLRGFQGDTTSYTIDTFLKLRKE